MRRKSMKIAAAFLSAVLMLQSGWTGVDAGISPVQTVLAEEAAVAEVETQGTADQEVAVVSETQPPTEEQTQPPTEAQTQPPTEAQTQPPTEAQTQPPTEVQTQPPTEAQTQPPTEAQTQPPTEAQTQPPTEAQTQPPTEAQTQPPTEAQTQDSEEEVILEEETETVVETERAERVNDGAEQSASDLVLALDKALPYVLAAKKVTLPNHLQDIDTIEQLIVDEKEGETIVSDLEKFSVKLANASASSDVEVINLYADEKGKLDLLQLEEQFDDQVIDVTQKYFVVNIIADHVDQDLDFSGFDMILGDEPVEYQEETQPGDILYNFAALDDKEEFTGYEGTVTLKEDLQGTVLAPEAKVKVGADLAGAVFAKEVDVQDSVNELLHIVFVDGKNPVQTEAATETTEEVFTEAVIETEAVTETVTETEVVTEALIETEAVTEIATETVIESVAEQTEALTEIITEVVTEKGTEETESETEELEVVLDLGLEEVLEAGTWFSEDGIIMKIQLSDTENTDENLAAVMNVEIRAAEEIADLDGNVLYEKDALVKVQEFTTEAFIDLGSSIQYDGIYYIDVTELGETKIYLDTARIYFSIDTEGNAVFKKAMERNAQDEDVIHAGGANWDDTQDQLEITLFRAAKEMNQEEKCLTVSLVDAADDTKQIASGAFVVKDNNGAVLTDEAAYPLYYLDYTGVKAVLQLDKLSDGTYYLSQVRTSEGYLIDAEDKEFQMKDGKVFFVEDGNNVGQDIVIKNSQIAQAEHAGTLTVTAKTYYNEVLLTAEEKNVHYVALFADADLKERVSAVQTLEYEPGTTESKETTFAGLAQGTQEAVTYYLAETDEFGTPVTDALRTDHMTYKVWNGLEESNQILFAALTEEAPEREQKEARLDFHCDTTDAMFYPETGYSYPVEVKVTKKVLDISNKETASDETFYFNIFRTIPNSSELGEAVLESPAAISMNGTASASASVQIKMQKLTEEFAIREVDKNGTVLTSDTKNFQYAVSYLQNPDGKFVVYCKSAKDEKDKSTGVAVPVQLTIENRKMESLVKLQAEDAQSGSLISGVTLVVKNKSGKIVLLDNQKTVTSGTAPIELKNVLTAGETYYLSALQTPSGYAVAADVAFTVNKTGETIVSLQYSPFKKTDYKLTVSKQVYSGKYPVYAYDTTNGAYAAKGAYTFYVALFADSARTQKVSDVQKVTVSALGGTTVFNNLEKGQTYYVGETDQYGQLKRSDDSVSVKYANKGVVSMTDKNKTTIIQNAYNSLPEGYRYTGTLTITKKVTNTSGVASKVTETFYAGIYRTADYSDTPTIVKLELKDASTVSVKRRILLSNSDDMVYYIAEVDAQGKRITDESDFTYSVKIDTPAVTVAKGADAVVTITNQVKSTKATLYLTKKVYNGTTQQAVSETFYAGLFKDAQFTQPYTKPVALKLDNKSEITLKLSLNLGTASNVKIYVAEVDADGNVIKDEKKFGYEIKLINSTAEFTPDRREVQVILLNSMFGTATTDDWNTIFNSDGNDVSSMGNTGYWGVSNNGTASEAPQTGDVTPILPLVTLMGAAMLILAGGLVRKRRA